MKNKKPTAAQESKWLSLVAEIGCVITRQTQVQIHHCVGREGKQDKYHIGRWFVLPLCERLHDVNSNDPCNVTHHRKTFIENFGLESLLFEDMCRTLYTNIRHLPFEPEVFDAIMATKR